jgi:nucleoside-diphosphate-sugar epimerase
MKVLFIGGTGNISTHVSKLAVEHGIDLYHLNRGTRPAINGVKEITADIDNALQVNNALQGHVWDIVVDWISFTPSQIQRDFDYFNGKVKQYIFIGSASAYQKPPKHFVITEETPLENPYWEYSRDKIACEDLLLKLYREENFPITVVRPSHTYDTIIPINIGGWDEYTMVDRIKRGLPVVAHGDGTSLWTLTHASDFAKGFVGLMGNANTIGEAYHITSDEALTWDQVYEAIGKAVGKQPNIVHIPSEYIVAYTEKIGYPSERGSLLGDKTYSALFDNTKVKTIVADFVCTTRFIDGIKQTIDWFEVNPEKQIIRDETHAMVDGLIAQYKSVS